MSNGNILVMPFSQCTHVLCDILLTLLVQHDEFIEGFVVQFIIRKSFVLFHGLGNYVGRMM